MRDMNLLNEKKTNTPNKFNVQDILSTEQLILNYREVNHSLLFLSFFSHYTAPLYQFDSIEFIKSFLPILLCVQGLVYEADIKIEKGQKDKSIFTGIDPWLKRKKIITSLAKKLNLYSPMLEKEADNLSEYWKIENKLMNDTEVSQELLIKAIELRASDIMMQHHICQKITKITFSKEVMETIQAIEIIRDIEADLRQYEKDIKNKDFNIYYMYTKLYGVQARSILSNELEKRKTAYTQMICALSPEYNKKFTELNNRYYTIRPSISVPECIIS